jgi:D-alanine--poly(phosphoribitol) ligase subunit 2
MSSPDASADQIGELVRTTLGVHPPGPDVDLIETGLIDSLSLVTLIAELETAFDVRFPLESFDVEDFRTLDRMAAVVNANRGDGT